MQSVIPLIFRFVSVIMWEQVKVLEIERFTIITTHVIIINYRNN